MRPRRVLIVSYDFPPSSIGIWRTLKFCRYMPEFGWRPGVLTVKSVRAPRWDRGPLRELPPGTPIRRTESLDANRLAHVASGLLRRRRPARGGSAPAETRPAVFSPGRRLLDIARRWILVPDDRLPWYPFALAEGRRWLRQTPFDAVYTTSFPNTSHLVGARLAREFRLPLVADFRDIWVGNYYFYQPATRCHDRLQRRLEASVVSTATAVVSATGPITADFLERYPKQPEAKFHTITNGFDPGDFDFAAARPDPTVYTITYAGTMYGSTSPRRFFEAVRSLLDRRPELRDVLRLRFIGTMLEEYAAMIDEFGVAAITRRDPYLAHGEALAAMAEADLLLLLVAPVEGAHIMLTQKVFEYAAARRPILGIVPRGAAHDFLMDLGEGPLCDARDTAAIAAAIGSELDRWLREGRRVLPDNPWLARFERRALTARLCTILDNAAAPSRETPR